MTVRRGPSTWAVDQGTLKQNDLELFKSGILADMEVKCGDRTWKVHKAILCTRSIWFDTAVEGSFKESLAETTAVTLGEKEQCDVDCFLKFLYTGSIDLQESYPGDDAFVALMRIWKMADFFVQDALRNLAVYAAKDWAREHAQVFCKALPGADHDKEVDSIIKNSFNPAVSLLYGEEMGPLKRIFLPIYMEMAIASVHELSKSKAFNGLLHRFPQFAADWATSLMRGFCKWEPVHPTRAAGCCDECAEDLDDEGTMDSLEWVRSKSVMVLCDECYRIPSLTEWDSVRR